VSVTKPAIELSTGAIVQHLHIERRRNQPALDLGLGRVAGLGRAQSGLDGVDALVAEAGDLDVGADLGRLGRELLADVGLELLGVSFARELDVGPDVGVAARLISQVSRSARAYTRHT